MCGLQGCIIFRNPWLIREIFFFSKLRQSWGCTVLTKYHHATFTYKSVSVELASVFVFNFCLYSHWFVFKFDFEYFWFVVSLRFQDPFRCIPSNRASGLQPLWTVEQFLTVLIIFTTTALWNSPKGAHNDLCIMHYQASLFLPLVRRNHLLRNSPFSVNL